MRSKIEEGVIEKYRRAGEIAAEARDNGIKLITEGASILEVVNKVESIILEEGAGLAFPTNISVNEVAAHFTPRHDDTSLVFKKGDVVKLDVGAHIDGYIADTALTIEIGSNNYSDMIKASRDALENAVDMIKDEVSLSDIGKVIEDSISSYGYKSIDNLTGHSLERYTLHSGLSIPNVSNRSNLVKLKVGDVLAVEPFATDGAGHVVSGIGSNIYRYVKSVRSRIVRSPKVRPLATKINKKFKSLPFAERWCADMFPDIDVSLKKLLFAGTIKQYPQLIDEGEGIVTQAEHTVIVGKDDCEVTT